MILTECKLFLCGVITLLTITNAMGALKNVTISKCCDTSEHISKEMKGYTCAVGEAQNWLPKIYSPRKKTFLKSGLTPSNWHIKKSQFPKCSNGARPTYTQSYLVFENGSLWLPEYDKLVHPDKYCIDLNSTFMCLEEVQSEEFANLSKVRKCCGNGAIYHDSKEKCVNMKGADYNIELDSKKTWIFGFPTCNEHMTVIAGKLDEGTLLDNGSILLVKSNVLLPQGNFCLEHVLENAGQSASIFTCHEFLPSSVTSIKAIDYDLRFTLYPIGLALSAIFLFATLAAGSLIRTNHHALQWRCQTNHLVCMLLGSILLCITQVAGRTMSSIPCFIIAVSMHFLFLAAFFWLNTMCFNIWWTFRDFRAQSMEKSQERFRLRLYEIYAWGGPLVIAGTAAVLDSIPETSEFAVLRPKFGTSNCWFHGDMEILTYFYGPIGILLIINLTLFCITARELTCGLWKRELESTTERATLDRICMKLVVVMGVTWMADLISWAVGGPQELWYVTDILNCLQGVFIFIVVGCRPQVLSAVKKWWCSRKQHTNGTVGTTNHHSSSSQGLPSMGDTITNNSISNTTKSVPMETSC